MSVATDLLTEHDPAVLAPGPARPERHLYAVPVRPARPAITPVRRGAGSVSVLRAPADVDRVPVRLTRRGVVVLALLVASVGAVLLWVAAASAPTEAAAPSNASVVTVRSGDTLWSIAGRVAPDTDPRAEVDQLRRLNHLDGVALVPGQHLRLR